MEVVERYDHQSGVHCGAAALRNVSGYYGWNDSEPKCFGIGGGPAFVLYEHPTEPWVTCRTSPLWLVRAYFERLGIPHLSRRGDDFDTAWEEVTARVDADDPVIVFLDPAALPYLPTQVPHVPPHVAVVTGYSEEAVRLSDAAMEEPMEVSHATLRDAWQTDRFLPLENEFLAVTRARKTEEGNDAAAVGLRQSATYMLDAIQIKRNARGPGEEGIAAMRAFANYLGTWPDLAEPDRPVRAAKRALDEHGDGQAFRGLFADSLGELGRRTGLTQDYGHRMERIGAEWQTVRDRLDEILETPQPARFEEAASLVGDIADREEAVFEDIADELGIVDDRE